MSTYEYFNRYTTATMSTGSSKTGDLTSGALRSNDLITSYHMSENDTVKIVRPPIAAERSAPPPKKKPEAPAVPNAPPVGGNPTSDTIEVTWKPHQDAKEAEVTGYRLYRNKGDGAGKDDYSVCVHNGVNDKRTTFVVSDLLPTTGYRFKVTALNAVGESQPSAASETVETLAEVKAIKKPGPPGVPVVSLSKRATHDTVFLDWDPPKDTGGGTILGYKVYRNKHGETGVPDVPCYDDKDDSASHARIGGLKPETSYSFAVSAYNSAGEGPKSGASAAVTTEAEEKAAVPPGIPEAPVVGETTKNSVQVKWLPPSSTGGGDITGYKVQHDGGTGAFEKIGYDGTGNASTECVVRNLAPATDYRFRVAAINSAGQSGWSEPSNAGRTTDDTTNDPPKEPRHLRVLSTQDRQASLEWADPGAGPAPTGYKIYRTDPAKPAGDFSTLAYDGSGKTATAADVKGLRPGTDYSFKASACNEHGEGPLSATAASAKTQTSLPGAPRKLAAEPVAGDPRRANLTWDAPEDDGGDPIVQYVVRRSDPPASSELATEAYRGSHPGGVADRLKTGQSYRFTVAACNGRGEGPASPSVSLDVPAGPPYEPGQPQAKGADPTTGNFSLTCSRPYDGGAPIKAYKLYHADTPQGDPTFFAQYDETPESTAQPEFLVKGIPVGSTKVFRVTAVNEHGEGPASPYSLPTGIDARPAAAPEKVEAQLGTERPDTTALVKVKKPASDGGAPITGYDIYANDELKSPAVAPAAAEGEGHLVTGLVPGATYTFTAVAHNAAKLASPKSAPSAPVTMHDPAAEARKKAEEEARKKAEEERLAAEAKERAAREAQEAADAKNKAKKDALMAEAQAKFLAAKPIINAVIENETGMDRVEIVSCKEGGAFKEAGVIDGVCCTTVGGQKVAGNENFKAVVASHKVGSVVPFTFIFRDKPNEPFVINVTINGSGFANMTEMRKWLRIKNGQFLPEDFQ